MPTRNGHDVGTRVVHRRYVPYSDAHYAGNLVDGAYSLKLFGDVNADGRALKVHEPVRTCPRRIMLAPIRRAKVGYSRVS